MNLWVWAVLLNQSEPTWIDLMTDEPLSNLAPDPELPDWRVGEIDEKGNRFWMVDYDGQGHFIKYVEYKPEWINYYSHPTNPFGFAKCHPMILGIDGVMYRSVIDEMIYPEQPPPDAIPFTSIINQPPTPWLRNNDHTQSPNSSPTRNSELRCSSLQRSRRT
jgi:hypothetical protein